MSIATYDLSLDEALSMISNLEVSIPTNSGKTQKTLKLVNLINGR